MGSVLMVQVCEAQRLDLADGHCGNPYCSLWLEDVGNIGLVGNQQEVTNHHTSSFEQHTYPLTATDNPQWREQCFVSMLSKQQLRRLLVSAKTARRGDKVGELCKMANNPRARKRWKKRFFVLEGNVLSYYKEQASARLKGEYTFWKSFAHQGIVPVIQSTRKNFRVVGGQSVPSVHWQGVKRIQWSQKKIRIFQNKVVFYRGKK